MAVVPVKPFDKGKSRLGQVLNATARAALSRELLERTLRILTRARGVDRVAVISRDDEALRLARRRGAWAMWETGRGLNQALEQASRVALANGVAGLLVVPADLPNLATSDIEQMIDLGRRPPCLVVAPDRAKRGTNSLLVRPAGLIRFAFGESSFVEHVRRGEQAGAQVAIYRSERVAFDLDLPGDLEEMEGRGRPAAAKSKRSV